MLMLTGYFDETGNPRDEEQKFNGMAGLIAPEVNWLNFEIAWRRVLRGFQIPYFHMREFAHSIENFKSFKGDEPKRQSLFRQLLDIIDLANPLPMGWIVPLEIYRSLSARDRDTFGEPYYRGFVHCTLLSAPLHASNQSPEEIANERIGLVFSDQVEFKYKALRYYDTAKQMFPLLQRVKPPSFDDMRQLVPLQAADIVAFEMKKEYERRLYYPKKDPRYGYQRLVGTANKALVPIGIGEKIPFAFVAEDDMAGYLQ